MKKTWHTYSRLLIPMVILLLFAAADGQDPARGQSSDQSRRLVTDNLNPIPSIPCNAPALNPASRQFKFQANALGWRMTGEITVNDGLLLHNLTFHGRMLVAEINLPYFELQQRGSSNPPMM